MRVGRGLVYGCTPLQAAELIAAPGASEPCLPSDAVDVEAQPGIQAKKAQRVLDFPARLQWEVGQALPRCKVAMVGDALYHPKRTNALPKGHWKEFRQVNDAV